MMAQSGNELADKCPNPIDRKASLRIICIDVYLVFVSLASFSGWRYMRRVERLTGSFPASLMRLNVQDTISILALIWSDFERERKKKMGRDSENLFKYSEDLKMRRVEGACQVAAGFMHQISESTWSVD